MSEKSNKKNTNPFLPTLSIFNWKPNQKAIEAAIQRVPSSPPQQISYSNIKSKGQRRG